MMGSPYIWTQEIPVVGEYDTVVAGGGVAGISAALASARCGAKTLLIEREWALGGLATLGLIAIYLPLCDGRGRQVSFGIAEELFRLAIRHGAAGPVPELFLRDADVSARAAGPRMQAEYNPWLFALLAEELLKGAGVSLLYGTGIVGADVKDGRLTALYTENKSGCGAIRGRSFIDCTGDADLCAFSGEETALFARQNILASWYYALEKSGHALHILGEADVTEEEEKRGRTVKRLSGLHFSGVNGQENSDMMCLAHEKLLAECLARKEADASFALTGMAMIPELRKTRRLKSALDMEKDAYLEYPDTVGVIADWRRRGPTYAVPYRALYGEKIKNLAAAGRCMGAKDEMWELTRVIPACAVTGEAIGTAAAFGRDFGDVDVAALQERLTKNGVRLNPERSRA